MRENTFEATSYLKQKMTECIETLNESAEDAIEITGAPGFFITKNDQLGEKVIYVDKTEINGVSYFAYQHNPLFKE